MKKAKCNVPGCKNHATVYWATVPVCNRCQLDLADESIEFYKKKLDVRPVFESIRDLSPWKKPEAGDKRQVTVANVKNGTILALKLGDSRYVLDRPNYYKGAEIV